MRLNIAVLLIFLLSWTAQAQKEISSDRMLYGYTLLNGDFKTYVIKFKKGHKYHLWLLPPRGQRAKRETGKWVLEEDKLTLLDGNTGKPFIILERQKNEW